MTRKIWTTPAATSVIAPLTMVLALSASWAETIDVYDNHGGLIARYDAQWREYASRGVNVRIIGPCQSACTILLRHVPRNRICVTPAASFGFHLAQSSDGTAKLWGGYEEDIRHWIEQHGGLKHEFIWLRAPDVFRFFRKCQG